MTRGVSREITIRLSSSECLTHEFPFYYEAFQFLASPLNLDISHLNLSWYRHVNLELLFVLIYIQHLFLRNERYQPNRVKRTSQFRSKLHHTRERILCLRFCRGISPLFGRFVPWRFIFRNTQTFVASFERSLEKTIASLLAANRVCIQSRVLLASWFDKHHVKVAETILFYTCPQCRDTYRALKIPVRVGIKNISTLNTGRVTGTSNDRRGPWTEGTEQPSLRDYYIYKGARFFPSLVKRQTNPGKNKEKFKSKLIRESYPLKVGES